MRLHPVLCFIAGRLGFESRVETFRSSLGTVEIAVCQRCASYKMEAHGIDFVGRVTNIPSDFEKIRGVLDVVGYTAASKEIGRLHEIMVEQNLA